VQAGLAASAVLWAPSQLVVMRGDRVGPAWVPLGGPGSELLTMP